MTISAPDANRVRLVHRKTVGLSVAGEAAFALGVGFFLRLADKKRLALRRFLRLLRLLRLICARLHCRLVLLWLAGRGARDPKEHKYGSGNNHQ
jgi:hypothetical protein